MFESIMNFFKKMTKKEEQTLKSKDAAKERLHLVLMQDRANVSADFLDLMKQEIIEVIKKYIDIDESAMDVRLTNKDNGDGSNGAPALYANIPILNIKDEVRQTAQVGKNNQAKQNKQEDKKHEDKKQDNKKQDTKKHVVKEQDNKEQNNKKQENKKQEVKEQKYNQNENKKHEQGQNNEKDRKVEQKQENLNQEKQKNDTNVKKEN